MLCEPTLRDFDRLVGEIKRRTDVSRGDERRLELVTEEPRRIFLPH